jgi:hypothetical protein
MLDFTKTMFAVGSSIRKRDLSSHQIDSVVEKSRRYWKRGQRKIHAPRSRSVARDEIRTRLALPPGARLTILLCSSLRLPCLVIRCAWLLRQESQTF